jgi:hypothetical protein
LPVSIKAEAERLAAADGTSLNPFVATAMAGKVAALRFRSRSMVQGVSGRGIQPFRRIRLTASRANSARN